MEKNNVKMQEQQLHHLEKVNQKLKKELFELGIMAVAKTNPDIDFNKKN